MIFYVVTRRHSYTMKTYARSWDRLRLLFYDDLFQATSLPIGTYIFTDIDRLTASERELAATVWNQLAVHMPRVRLLNDPSRVLCRYELMRELASTGDNHYRARRSTDGLNDLRYPVFIRCEREHKGSLTPLLHSAAEVRRALLFAHSNAYQSRDLLIVEFCDTSDAAGLFRKYAAFVVGNEVLPRHLFISRNWHQKQPDRADADAAREVEAYLEGNPHEELIRRIFRRAGIDYGRIDYSMAGDQPQVWEINTNPHVRKLAESLSAAFGRLDAGPSNSLRPIPICLDSRLAAAAERERRSELRLQNTRKYVADLLTSWGVRPLKASEGEPAQVAVVILAWGSPSKTVDTVRSLLDQKARVEVVVVNIDGGMRQLLARNNLKVLVIECQSNLNIGAARNIGIRATRAPYVAFLATDCITPAGWARRLIRAHDRVASIAGCAVKNDNPRNPFAWACYLATWAGSPYESRAGFTSYDRRLLERHGLFREAVRGAGEAHINDHLPLDQRPVQNRKIVTIHQTPTRLLSLISNQLQRGIAAARSGYGDADGSRSLAHGFAAWRRTTGSALRSSREVDKKYLVYIWLARPLIPIAVAAYYIGVWITLCQNASLGGGVARRDADGSLPQGSSGISDAKNSHRRG